MRNIFATILILISSPCVYGQTAAYYTTESEVDYQYEKKNLFYYNQSNRKFVRMVPKKHTNNWLMYGMYGDLHYYDGTGTKLQKKAIGSLGVLYGANNSVGIGAYIQSNMHYGGMIRVNATSFMKVRLLVGQTDQTSYNETLTPDPEQRLGKTLSFGVGIDIPLFWRLGLAIQGFSSASGNGGYNNEITYGLFYNF